VPAAETDSAEWIVEAPSSCLAPVCAPLPIAHFGRITFVSATATLNGRVHPLADSRVPTELYAIGRRGRVAVHPVPPEPWRAAGSVLG
jgi:Peptidase A4 family